MKRTRRPIYGVVAAGASYIEQRETLSGVIHKAQELDIDTVVITNVYNPVQTDDSLCTENKIYDLLLTDEFDGLILISESIMNPDLQLQIKNNLVIHSDIPIIVIGTYIPDFDLPNIKFINTSDELDIKCITDHMIEQHGFSSIYLLTGPEQLDASHLRINGYKRSLTSHGIAYDESKVFFGDFWLTSGKSLAERLINGELEYPEALVCANDYMAYGLLDEFSEKSVPLPEKMSLIGYEYIHERHFHTPILTTYRRNRGAVGEDAVRLISERNQTGSFGRFEPPAGILVPGDSCSCGIRGIDLHWELLTARTKMYYDDLNLYSQLDQRLTEARNLDEFIAVCRGFMNLVRGADELYLCLRENWYDQNADSENIVRYNVIHSEAPKTFHMKNFSAILTGPAAAYYFCPLFFSDRLLGWITVKYKLPDTFDDIFRNWIKSVSNGLEFLRMKNDIQYLSSCQNLSEHRDTLTGMFNESGIRNAFFNTDDMSDLPLHFVGMKIMLSGEEQSLTSSSERVAAVLDAAEAVRQFCGNRDICARIGDDIFVCLIRSAAPDSVLTGSLGAILCQHRKYLSRYGIDSFLCFSEECSGRSFPELFAMCSESFYEGGKELAGRRRNQHYRELLGIRNYIYLHPSETFSTEAITGLYDGSEGHLRALYKKCFGASFHKDCIAARVARAKYYLSVTALSVADISEKCGYTDSKYFLRQFLSETGMTTVQYRGLIK